MSVSIPNSVKEIGSYAFNGCNALISVSIPDSVTEIGSGTFYECSALTSLTIPNSVKEIGNEAFYGCSSLESISLSDSLQTIHYALFRNCKSLKALVLPGSIQHIEQQLNRRQSSYTFDNCESLKNLSILNSTDSLSVGYVNEYFNGSDYEDIYKPSDWYSWTDKIETLFIDRSLEKNIPVPNLQKLELGESIKTVQIENFSSLEKLNTIESHALVPPVLEGVSNTQFSTVSVSVPAEALDAYKADPVWGQFWNLQSSGVDNLKAEANTIFEIGRYDINGRSVSEDYSGLVIVRFSDGSHKKMLNR